METLELHPLDCEQCGRTVGYANTRSRLRTLQVVCSPSCAHDHYREEYAQVRLKSIDCANCAETLAHVELETPTARLKLVCSQSCARDFWDNSFVAVREP